MSEDSLIGRQLANFRIERAIGRGGMAQVYYGQDVKLERPVAIKVIDVRYRGEPSYAERFVREAKAVATWHHENIIQIYYADDEGDLYYFAMEYIDGPDLGQLMAQYATQGKLMPHNEVLQIGRAVASALDYAHQQGLIHRDVKPANVMVAPDGRVVLTDFGLAMDIQQGSIGEVFGSSHYIAPEQAHRSADAVPQSDLYSLGVILYELLTGKVPFDDPSPTAVALQHLTLRPPRPREVNPNLSPEIEAVLLKALGKTAEERYQTGADLIAALEEALQTVSSTYATQPEHPAASTAGRPEVAPAQPTPVSEVAAEDLIGQQLDEYRLEALLGQGGMARVYRGLDVRLNRWVAIKVIDTPFRTDSDYVTRFEREAQAIAQLEHGHIVRLYRYGEAHGLLYMAMQYVEGADLEAVLSTYRAEGAFIEPEEASRIVREVCQALDYAHNKGVIHRDVKPSNIMLDTEGCVILTDFGLALLTEVGTRGEIFGSPHYIAPEQAISSAGAVPQSDLYAVGIILYEMFTAEVPFEAEKPLDVAMMHIDETPRPPGQLRPEISPELEAVILKALAKEPEDRYPNGAALADALDQALHLAPAAAPASSRLSIPQRVANSLADYPLPPVPSAVSTPEPKLPPSEPEPEPEPAPAPSPPPATEPEPDPRLTGSEPTPSSIPATPVEEASPLPPIPAAASDSELTAAEPEQPSSPAPASDRQAEEKEADYALPPIPAAATTPESGQAAPPEPDLPPAPPTPAAAPEPVAPAAAPEPVAPSTAANPSLDKRLLAYVAGLGAILTVGIVLVILLLAVILFLLLWNRLGGQDLTAGLLPPAAATVPAEVSPGGDNGEDSGQVVPTATLLSAPAVVTPTIETPTILPSPTETSVPTATFTPESPPATPSPSPISYNLLLAKEGEDSLFVVNRAAAAFPLAGLRLGEGEGAIDGADWGVDRLESEACVTAWKSEGNPKPAPVTCREVGEALIRSGAGIFWKDDFEVYFEGELLGSCEKKETTCEFTVMPE